MLKIGSHVSYGSKQLLGSVEEAISYKANALMFYTGAPTNTVRKDIDDKLTKDACSLMIDNGIEIENVICHAPYIINLANTSDLSKYEFSIEFLAKEVYRCSELGVKYIVLHPGSAVGVTREEGLNNIVNALNKVLDNDFDVTILLETMAGKGNELGINLDEIKYIIDGVLFKDKIGVCVDTCHINDAGYDISKFDEYLDDFDNSIGINKIGCLHINDSKNDIGSHKDRHDNIGFGTIGFDNLINVIYNPRLENVTKILETPYIGNFDDDKERLYPPYKYEIEMIRNKEFNENIMNDIRSEYKKD